MIEAEPRGLQASLLLAIVILGPLSGAHINRTATPARALSDTFVGIVPRSAAPSILELRLGALEAYGLSSWLLKEGTAERIAAIADPSAQGASL